MNGFWAVEPHKDQCFHKHALMYVNKKHYDELVILINKHFRHSENAVRIEEIDAKKSKATSYVMKYLTKSFNLEFELKGGVLNVDKLEISNHKKLEQFKHCGLCVDMQCSALRIRFHCGES